MVGTRFEIQLAPNNRHSFLHLYGLQSSRFLLVLSSLRITTRIMSTPNARTLSHRQAKQLAVLLSDDHTPDYLFHNNSEAQFESNPSALPHEAGASLSRKSLSKLGSMAKAMSTKTSALFHRKKLPTNWESTLVSPTEQTGVPSIVVTDAPEWAPTTHALSEERQSILSMAPTDEGSIASSEITTPLDVDVSNPWDNVPLFKAPNAMCNVSEEPELQESSLDTLETEEIQRILPVTRVVQHTVQSEATLSDEGPITSIHFQPTIDTVRRVASSGRLQ